MHAAEPAAPAKPAAKPKVKVKVKTGAVRTKQAGQADDGSTKPKVKVTVKVKVKPFSVLTGFKPLESDVFPTRMEHLGESEGERVGEL